MAYALPCAGNPRGPCSTQAQEGAEASKQPHVCLATSTERPVRGEPAGRPPSSGSARRTATRTAGEQAHAGVWAESVSEALDAGRVSVDGGSGGHILPSDPAAESDCAAIVRGSILRVGTLPLRCEGQRAGGDALRAPHAQARASRRPTEASTAPTRRPRLGPCRGQGRRPRPRRTPCSAPGRQAPRAGSRRQHPTQGDPHPTRSARHRPRPAAPRHAAGHGPRASGDLALRGGGPARCEGMITWLRGP